MLDSLLIQLQDERPGRLKVFSCEIFENIKNPYFEEHLRTTAPERFRKKIALLVLGKPTLDGK